MLILSGWFHRPLTSTSSVDQFSRRVRVPVAGHRLGIDGVEEIGGNLQKVINSSTVGPLPMEPRGIMFELSIGRKGNQSGLEQGWQESIFLQV